MEPSRPSAIASRQPLLDRNGWIALFLLLPLLWCASARGAAFPLHQFRTQDLPVIAGLIPLLLLISRWSPRWAVPTARPRTVHIALGGLLLALAMWWGSHALMGNYPLSRDEHMVVFDMAVYANGHLAEPMAPQWRGFARDLVPAFLLDEDMPAGLVSSYLPVNALLRVLFSFIADPALMNPLLVLCGGLALLSIARRLFGDDNRPIWVALLVYALSAQMAVNAMTTYAMTAHMALNLLWLAAFLRGRWWGHVLAIAIAFIATGLHQIVFHPLFVAPFLLWRLREGQRRIVLVYGLAYVLILGWWMAYPMLAALEAGAAAIGAGPRDSLFFDRVWRVLVQREPMTIPYMTLNVLRFISWQHLALLPLLVSAAPLALRTRTIAAPLLWGLVGTILFFGLVLPYQGHGWGYRYLHPLLGSCALLAGLGYRRLAELKGRAADGMVLSLSLATALLSMPWLLYQTRQFAAPDLALAELVAHQRTAFILLDTEEARETADGGWTYNAIDQVRNRPDLSNRPLRVSSRAMPQKKLAELCRRGTVTIITRADMHGVGFALNSPAESPRFERMVAQTRRDYPACLQAAR